MRELGHSLSTATIISERSVLFGESTAAAVIRLNDMSHNTTLILTVILRCHHSSSTSRPESLLSVSDGFNVFSSCQASHWFPFTSVQNKHVYSSKLEHHHTALM